MRRAATRRPRRRRPRKYVELRAALSALAACVSEDLADAVR
jgi:hypothetical protein